MTLRELIQVIEGVASDQPSVNMVVENDVFRINSISDAKYGIFAFVQQQHSSSVSSNLMTWAFSLFYVDRLMDDRSNQIEIQSVGIQTLDNIIRKLDDLGIYCDNTYTFQVFSQRFLDDCAGVFCNVRLDVPVDHPCPYDYPKNTNVTIV